MRHAFVLLALLASAVHAQEPAGFYVAPELGVSSMDDTDLKADALTALGVAVEAEMDTSAYVGVALGSDLYRAYGQPVRVEAEVVRRDNDIDTVTFSGPSGSVTCAQAGIACSGDVEGTALLANVWYDFNRQAALRPYIGAGLGFVSADGTLRVTDPATGQTISDSGDDTVIAYQVGAGLGYAFTEHVTAALDLRYLATDDPDLDGVEIEYAHQSVGASVRLAF